MRRGKANEFSGRYDLGFLPESREMLLIARDQIVCAGSIGTLKEHVVLGVACDIQAEGRSDGIAVVFDELQQLLPETLANSQFGATKDFRRALGHTQQNEPTRCGSRARTT